MYTNTATVYRSRSPPADVYKETKEPRNQVNEREETHEFRK